MASKHKTPISNSIVGIRIFHLKNDAVFIGPEIMVVAQDFKTFSNAHFQVAVDVQFLFWITTNAHKAGTRIQNGVGR